MCHSGGGGGGRGVGRGVARPLGPLLCCEPEMRQEGIVWHAGLAVAALAHRGIPYCVEPGRFGAQIGHAERCCMYSGSFRRKLLQLK